MSLRTPLILALSACGPDIDPLTTDMNPTASPTSPDPTASPTNPPTTDPDPGATTDAPEPTTGGLPPAITGGVDILFVIDDSNTMADEQSTLAANIGALLGPLEQAGLDYRVAVTTTDSGNPRCAGSTPEGGRLVATSCIDRAGQGDFLYGDEDYSFACADLCASQFELAPTATELDPSAAPRPWLERIGGATNLPAELSVVQAAQCLLPQGVAGCGYEQPLESMYLALQQARTPGDASYGFMRGGADLLVVFLTDETDCSYAPSGADIFTTNKVFWNDPADPAPTSAVCWRAGVRCTGGGPYDCEAADIGLDGAPAGPGDAALHPVSRYTGLLQDIAAEKQAVGDGRVLLAAIAGVPSGYPDAPLVFDAGVDPQFEADFGIAPGCTLPGRDPQLPAARAVPPLRIKEVVESAPAGPGLLSICEYDYSAALATIAGALVP